MVNEKVMDKEVNNPDRRKDIIDELSNRKKKEVEQQQARLKTFLFGLVFFVVGIYTWIESELVASYFVYNSFDGSDRYLKEAINNAKITGSFLVLISTVFFAYLYMVGFHPRKVRNQIIASTTNGDGARATDDIEIVTLLKSIDTSIRNGRLDSALSEHDRNEIVIKISETIESQLNSSLLSRIEEKYGESIHDEKMSLMAYEKLDGTIQRLKDYVEDLKNKATVNLVYGITATIFAIGILVFVLFNASHSDNVSKIATILYYTSRLFLVILVQGISIFFLNLYKSTLNNVSYVNNEITNHEAKRDALSIMLRSGNRDATTTLLVSLAATERNFTLKKGETSIFDKGANYVEPTVSSQVITDFLAATGKK